MSDGATRAPRDPRGLLLGILAGAAVGFAAQGSLPLLLAAVMRELGLNEAAAGLLASLEIGMFAVTSLLLAPRIDRVPRGRLAMLGASVACLGQALSIGAASFETLLAARVIAGLGEGATFAAANAALAGSVAPERLSALLALLGGAGAGVLLLILPWVVEPFGYAGGFALLLGVGLGSLPLLRFLPEPRKRSTRDRVGLPGHRVLGCATLAAFFALSVGGSAMWAFTGRIGINAGLSLQATSRLLALTMVLGLSGAALASLVGTRFGRVLPLCAGLLGIAVSTAALGGAQAWPVYAATLVAWTFAFLFVMPYLMGTAAALDRDGRWAAATVGLWAVGSALGPASAGALIAVVSYAALGRLVAASALLALLLVAPVAFALGRSPAQESEA